MVDWAAEIALNRRWLATVIYARVRDPAAVDDVLQEMSLAAVKCRERLVGQHATARWLYRIAVRQALLYCRQRRREAGKVTRFAATVAPDGRTAREMDPVRRIARAERRELVRQALLHVASRDREILLLKYTEGWSCRELAEKLGIAESAVKTRLLRARARLRDALLQLDEDWTIP